MTVTDRYWGAFALRHLALLTRQGMPLHRALELVARDVPVRRLSRAMQQSARAAEAGVAPGEIPELRNLIPAPLAGLFRLAVDGESVAEAFRECGDWQAREVEQRVGQGGQLATPGIILSGWLGLLFTMMVVLPPVVGRFSLIYKQLGSSLPYSTRAVLAVMLPLRTHGVSLFVGIVIALGLLLAAGWGRERHPLAARLCWELKFLSPISRLRFASALLRHLSLGLRMGLPLERIVRSFSEGVRDAVWREVSRGLAVAVAAGEELPAAVQRLEIPSEDLSRLMSRLDRNEAGPEEFRAGAGRLDERLRRRWRTLGQVLTALNIALIGILVGTVVVAMYMPIWRIIRGMAG